MAKKRSCRRTETERIAHERAVSLRKMSDAHLIEHVDGQYAAGFDACRIGIEATEQEVAEKILKAISTIKGIGAATITKIIAAIDEVTGGVE